MLPIPPNSNKRIYFPNLNAIRAIAAFMVIIYHIEQYKSEFGLPNYYLHPIIGNWGFLGVLLFFVLSGFLITYLLLAERQRTRTINIRQFYRKRICRIWPLYYVLVGLALFVLPHLPILNMPGADTRPTRAHLVYYGLFLTNMTLGIAPIQFTLQTWSIGTEEQFYLIWPLILKYTRNKYVALLGVLAGYTTLSVLAHAFNPTVGSFNPAQYLGLFCIDSMAIGGLAAALLIDNHRAVLNVLHSRRCQLLSLGLLLGLIAYGTPWKGLHFTLYSVLFAVLVLNFATSPVPIVNLENPVLNYLGKISFGLYMLHPIVIVACINTLTALQLGMGWLYPLSLLLTVALSALSYQFLEKRFLTMTLPARPVPAGPQPVLPAPNELAAAA